MFVLPAFLTVLLWKKHIKYEIISMENKSNEETEENYRYYLYKKVYSKHLT